MFLKFVVYNYFMFELALNSFGLWLTIAVVTLANAINYNGAKQRSQEQAYQWFYTLIKAHSVVIPPEVEEEHKKLQDHAINEIGRNDKMLMINLFICFIAIIGCFITY